MLCVCMYISLVMYVCIYARVCVCVCVCVCRYTGEMFSAADLAMLARDACNLQAHIVHEAQMLKSQCWG